MLQNIFLVHEKTNVKVTPKTASLQEEMSKEIRLLAEMFNLTMNTDPKVLPHDNTESVKYLEDTQSKNTKEMIDVIQMNLYNMESTILTEGSTGIQKSIFNESFMDVTNAVISRNKSGPCKLCEKTKGFSDICEATMRCLDCCENYCLPCSEAHKSEHLTKDHIIVDLKSEYIEEKIRNIFPIRKCDKHLGKVLDYYCCDCKSVVCVTCYVECHKNHNCKHIAAVDENFRQQLKESVAKINYYRKQISSKQLDMETQKKEFSEKTLEMENSVQRRSQQMKMLIDQHTQDVLDEIAFIKQKRQTQMEREMDEIQTKAAIFEGFATGCDELRTRGSPSDVCGDAAKSIERAEELSKEIEEYLNEPRISVDIRFTATDENMLLQKVTNVLGKVSGMSDYLPNYRDRRTTNYLQANTIVLKLVLNAFTLFNPWLYSFVVFQATC